MLNLETKSFFISDRTLLPERGYARHGTFLSAGFLIAYRGHHEGCRRNRDRITETDLEERSLSCYNHAMKHISSLLSPRGLSSLFLAVMLVLAVSAVWLGLSVATAPPALADHCGDRGVHLSVPLPGRGDCIFGSPGSGGVIMAYVRLVIAFLSSLVGLVVILMLVIAGVQYITAAGNSSQVAAAKGRIQNALIGLFLFILMYAILNYLIPGGIIGS